MRIGVFGGSFDPVHLAHLVLAEQCREQGRLDRVLFVPAFRPPHKPDRQLARFDHRLEMLQLAVAGHPQFQVSAIENGRDPSYTVDTLRQLHREQPGDEFLLLIGSDSLKWLPSWHQPEQLAELATLLVMARPDATADTPVPPPFRAQWAHAPLLGLSSTDLRQRVREGRSIRYLVPRAVECYVEQHRLYR
jgi:nicotinate-nucleotide adenylyltransferase